MRLWRLLLHLHHEGKNHTDNHARSPEDDLLKQGHENSFWKVFAVQDHQQTMKIRAAHMNKHFACLKTARFFPCSGTIIVSYFIYSHGITSFKARTKIIAFAASLLIIETLQPQHLHTSRCRWISGILFHGRISNGSFFVIHNKLYLSQCVQMQVPTA